MNTSMFIIALDEVVKARGISLYSVARHSTIPYNTLQRMVSRKGEQTSIDLSVLSRLCSTLDCTPNDLLRYVPDKEDEAIRLLVKGIGGGLRRGRPKTKGGAAK
jgi:DNA-binding Xre family transcriptional regulator